MPIDAALTSWRDPLLAPDQPGRFSHRVVLVVRCSWAVAQVHRSGFRGSRSLEPPALRGYLGVGMSRRVASWRSDPPAIPELGNREPKWATVWSQPRTIDLGQSSWGHLADQLRVLVGLVAPHEAWATSSSCLYMQCDEQGGGLIPPQALFFAAQPTAPAAPAPRHRAPATAPATATATARAPIE